jgi:transketolase
VRTAFIDTLFELASRDSRITLVVGDLGFGVVTRFMNELPAQFVNAGVAEQNMTGLAAGMALSGRTVFTYSIANFPVVRCLEQIRNDVCYHKADVKIVAVGGGYAYGALGYSHHAIEDIAFMRALPNMTVVAPNDPVEAQLATRAIASLPGPCYLRLGRAGEPRIHQSLPEFSLGRAITVRDGRDVSILATGGLLAIALAAADALTAAGITTRVLSMHTIKPLDIDAVLLAATETGAVVTLEEHSIIGGLGGAVAEVLLEAGVRPPLFKRIGLADSVMAAVGNQEYLRKCAGLDVHGVTATIRELLRHSRGVPRRSGRQQHRLASDASRAPSFQGDSAPATRAR